MPTIIYPPVSSQVLFSFHKSMINPAARQVANQKRKRQCPQESDSNKSLKEQTYPEQPATFVWTILDAATVFFQSGIKLGVISPSYLPISVSFDHSRLRFPGKHRRPRRGTQNATAQRISLRATGPNHAHSCLHVINPAPPNLPSFIINLA